MGQTKQELSDQQMEDTLSNVLRVGVIAAAVVVFIGGFLYLMRYGNASPDYGTFRGVPAELRQPDTIVRDALLFKRRAMIELGLLLLIATPIARVIFSAFIFRRQHDYSYLCICLIVLAILIYSLASGYWK